MRPVRIFEVLRTPSEPARFAVTRAGCARPIDRLRSSPALGAYPPSCSAYDFAFARLVITDKSPDREMPFGCTAIKRPLLGAYTGP